MARVQFRPRLIVDIYRLARTGASRKTMAAELGITPSTLHTWKKNYASVRYALWRAEQDRRKAETTSWAEYVRGRLPPELQKVWDRLEGFARSPNGYTQAERLVKKQSVLARQQLLVYAVLSTGFNLAKALRRVGIERHTFIDWMENDPDFTQLLFEVQEVKKDFFEEGLVRLVESGDSPATIFAARTVNRDRGYGERVDHHVSGMVGVATVPLGELDLPPETLRQILEACKRREVEGSPPVGLPPARRLTATVRDERRHCENGHEEEDDDDEDHAG